MIDSLLVIEKSEESLATSPQEVSSEDRYHNDWGLQDRRATSDEDIEGEDVDHDRTEH